MKQAQIRRHFSVPGDRAVDLPRWVLLEMSPLPLVLWHEQHPKGHERDFDHWLQIFGNYLPENSLVQMSQVCV
jgi:hypothetical protein